MQPPPVGPSMRPPPPAAPPPNGPPGDDALSRWRRKTRARLLEWMPLSAWRALCGIVLLLVAGVLRKVGIIQAPGFDLLLAIGLSLLGYQIAVDRKKNGEKS
jgi:hypothetical protein